MPITPSDRTPSDLRPPIVVVMGVAGAGKTTIGVSLAAALGARFLEGDHFHPPASVAKMSAGMPLDDADRRPWLERLAEEIDSARRAGQAVVLACSALRRAYRDILRRGHDDVVFLYLAGEKAMIGSRLAARRVHFMPAALLESQFAALEPPGEDETAIRIDVAADPARIVGEAIERLAGTVPTTVRNR